MDSREQRTLTDALLPAIMAAGRLEMGYFDAGCAVAVKADRSPVTIADQEAEAMILARLAAIFPSLTVIGEEAFAGGARPPMTEPFLLVDALDGTKQFVSGFREFTINVAVVAHGCPVYGLVYAPALGDLLVTDGPGVCLRATLPPSAEVQGVTLESVSPRRTRVAPSLEGGLIALQSRSRNLEKTNEWLKAFQVRERRQLGSSYKFALIAAGEADLYPQFGDTREWDTAAGEAILAAAGGLVRTLDGEPMRYGKRGVEYLNPAFIASSVALERFPR